MIVRELTVSEYQVVAQAMDVLGSVLREPGVVLTSPERVSEYLRLQVSLLPHEVFVVLFVDARHALIEAREMFRGTLTQTAVYPREIAKAALLLNAAAVVLCHNHPSGHCEPSTADRHLTDAVRRALSLIDVTVLDHVVVAGTESLSFAARGWL